MELLTIPDNEYQNLRTKALKVAQGYSSPALAQQHLELYHELLL
ncbi:hypothetical protein [Legionella rubrilucens]|nr:hypothetical protein [Legionella rubrilucens]